MKRFARQFQLDLTAEIYASEGAIFAIAKSGIKQFDPVIDNYKNILHKAGQEIITDGRLTAETQGMLEKEFIPVESYRQLMNKIAAMTVNK